MTTPAIRWNPVAEAVSDQDGYARFEGLTLTGRVYLKELECEGYQVDTQLKTVSLNAGKTTRIEWKNTPITGQLQIYKYAAEYNTVTGTAAGTPLPNAVYEITDVRTGKVVCQIVTDARGVAASKPLPLKRYQVKEVTAPTLSVQVNGNAVNGYTMVNRADAGGRYAGTWQTANASWATTIIKLSKTPVLPQTGY